MNHIRHQLVIDSEIERIFDAVTTEKGLRGWWSPEARALPKEGATLYFPFENDYYKQMRVEQFAQPTYVEWLTLHAHPEWVGTRISFKLAPYNDQVMLSFAHDNWQHYTPEFAACNYNWALFLRSLRAYCETGVGTPWPQQHV